MHADEWATAWHDWLRGVLLVGFLALLTGLYFLKWIPTDIFPLVMGGASLVVVLGFVLEHCICSLVPLWMRLATLVLVLGAGGGLLASIHVETTPGAMVAQGRLSPSHPNVEGYVPTTGDVLLDVRAIPGLLSKGDDGQVEARATLTYRQHAHDLETQLRQKWVFRAAPEGTGKKGGGSSVTSVVVHLEDVREGGFAVELESLEPAHARPLELTAFVALFPAWTLRAGLALLVVLSLLLAPLYSRRSAFPAFVPGTLVLAASGVAVTTGLPPDSPAPKLLGILVASAFGGALVGYVLAKAVVWAFPSVLAARANARAGQKPTSLRGTRPAP